MSQINNEIKSGERFEFGRNWQSFLTTLDEARINEAQRSLTNLLGITDLRDKTFLDIGSGSGIFSLAAFRLGARVFSFDYDPDSVACTEFLREKFANTDKEFWQIEQGSILDEQYLSKLGVFDIVYSWGVLHHTGSMWRAIENFSKMVKPGGYACIAIYNDQGVASKVWTKVKAKYCSGKAGKIFISALFFPYFFLRLLISSILKKKNQFAEYKKNRGMSVIHDWVDWLGGYPFEVATVNEIFTFFKNKNFRLENIFTTESLGNNEFVFSRNN